MFRSKQYYDKEGQKAIDFNFRISYVGGIFIRCCIIFYGRGCASNVSSVRITALDLPDNSSNEIFKTSVPV